MNIVDQPQIGIDGSGEISRTIDSPDNCYLPTSRERIPVKPGHGRSVTVGGGNSSSIKMFLLVGEAFKTRNSE